MYFVADGQIDLSRGKIYQVNADRGIGGDNQANGEQVREKKTGVVWYKTSVAVKRDVYIMKMCASALINKNSMELIGI